LTIQYKGDAYSTVIQAGDSISYVCGSAGNGLDYCGPRTIKLVTTQNGLQTQPKFLSFDSSLNTLTLQSTDKSDIGFYEVEVWVKLLNHGLSFQLLQTIPVTVTAECPDSTLTPFELDWSLISIKVNGAAY